MYFSHPGNKNQCIYEYIFFKNKLFIFTFQTVLTRIVFIDIDISLNQNAEGLLCFFALIVNPACLQAVAVTPPHVPGNDAVDSSRGYNADISHAASERLATLLFGGHLRKQQRVPEWATAEERIARPGCWEQRTPPKKDAAEPTHPPRLGVRAACAAGSCGAPLGTLVSLVVVVVVRGQRQS